MEIREIRKEVDKLKLECIQKAIEYGRLSDIAYNKLETDEEGDMINHPDNWKWLTESHKYEVLNNKAYDAEEKLRDATNILTEILEEIIKA